MGGVGGGLGVRIPRIQRRVRWPSHEKRPGPRKVEDILKDSR